MFTMGPQGVSFLENMPFKEEEGGGRGFEKRKGRKMKAPAPYK
jgi:hypothetical protein